jgi:hypothetical protein
MIPQEAITLVKECGFNIETTKHFECEKVVLNALEKQIPKKPIENRYPWAICPICGGSVYLEKVQEHIQNNETTYCEHCGQALDWRETE